MHEMALADAVIETVEKNLNGKNPASLKQVVVKLGELQNIDIEIFKHGLKTLLSEREIDYSIFSIEIESVSFHCNNCGKKWKLAELTDISEDEREAIHFLPEMVHVYISCPACGSKDFSIQEGRGVSISSIEFNNEI